MLFGAVNCGCMADALDVPDAGFVATLYVMFGWWADVVAESQAGDHTPVVRIGLRYGFIMFIMSEVMFFVAWFWSFFKHAMYPMAAERGRGWYLAARRDRNIRSVAPATDQHADPAVLGCGGHMGASCAWCMKTTAKT
jgi:hypothetical protein